MSASHLAISEIRRMKRRAEAAADPDSCPVVAEGVLDPSGVVAVFDRLSIKPGWRLEAYLLEESLGSESRVVAVPPRDGPAAESGKDGHELYLAGSIREAIDIPPESTDRFMRAIDGDGSDCSHLCASLLVRQLTDFAASWHALYAHDWFEHTVLASWPPPRTRGGDYSEIGPRHLTSEERSYFKRIPGGLPGADEPWWARLRWAGRMPTHWRPRVTRADDTVTVTMYTYRPSSAVSEGVWLHRDTYASGSYDPSVHDERVAEGLPSTICY